MSVRQYLIASLILHAALITVCFYLVCLERTCALLIDSVTVSLVEEMKTSESIDSSYLSPPQLPTISSGMQGNIDIGKVDISVSLSQHSGISRETGLLLSNAKENKSNPTLPHFTKGWAGGSLTQDIASQNMGRSRSEDEIIENIVVETTNKEDTNLYSLIRTLIERAKSYPLLARKRGMEGTVLVSFAIDIKGLPQYVKIMKSSGYQILDEEVKKMITRSSPFPEFKGEIVIPITFKLKDTTSDQ